VKTNTKNVLVICLKLGLKILSMTAKSGKFWMAGASAASYAYIYSWKFAIIIMFQLFVHEYGHIWAMKRCGLKIKGVYFIPFLGAAAVTDDDLAKSGRADELYIAIMGPIWGFFPAILCGILAVIYDSQFFMAAASWMCIVNLFNLIPLNPLDGGRIVKSLAFSLSDWTGLLSMFLGMVLLFAGCLFAGIGVFAVLGVISMIELLFEFRLMRRSGAELALAKESLSEVNGRRLLLMAFHPGECNCQTCKDNRYRFKESLKSLAELEKLITERIERIERIGKPRPKITGARQWFLLALCYIIIIVVFFLVMTATDLGGAMEILAA